MLPGYEVIAVDERDPEEPNAIVTNPDELPDYGDASDLLSDPSYVRARRLWWEGLFKAMKDDKDTRSFGDFLEHAVGVMSESQEVETASQREGALRALAELNAVKIDYAYDRNAFASRCC